ncbi:pyridoxal phosphate-dependent decarboxylase family protein [Skermania piniformis]|uniref:pyridoxal phosphate-dependent decarboxylase family protein n=1 Tax=Skermania pinensis TaxID=39122 RepID=UPI00146FF4EF|nr:pyridoxal-dependent decarboxylase [Skermania piniformis]
MSEFFFRDLGQVEELLQRYLRAILPLKRRDRPTFTDYGVFDYADVLDDYAVEYTGAGDETMIEELRSMFTNAVNWDCVGTLYNVHPNLSLHAQVASFVSSFANPNLGQDVSSGQFAATERSLVRIMSELAGWATDGRGIFTFGGKATSLYGVKLALDRHQPDLRRRGLVGRPVVLSTDVGHPCHVEVCNWLGIGEDNCDRLPTTAGVLDPEVLAAALRAHYRSGATPVCIVATGCSTNSHSVDRFAEIADVAGAVAAEFGAVRPWLHVDAVIGWVYLLLARYDFVGNPLDIPEQVATILHNKYRMMADVKFADSFGIDFHKTGFAGYNSSLFLTRHPEILHSIEGGYVESDPMRFSDYSPYLYSLELSRSAHGPVSAWAALRSLGFEGFTRILADQTAGYLRLKQLLGADSRFQVLNRTEESNLVLVTLLPPDLEQVDADTPPDAVARVRALNEQFHRFVIAQHAESASPVFFSISRGYDFDGLQLAPVKLYSFNSHFDRAAAEANYAAIVDLVHRFGRDSAGVGYFNWIEFMQLKDTRGRAAQ